MEPKNEPNRIRNFIKSVWDFLGVPCAKAAGFYIANDS